jgi:hypothetical protein
MLATWAWVRQAGRPPALAAILISRFDRLPGLKAGWHSFAAEKI